MECVGQRFVPFVSASAHAHATKNYPTLQPTANIFFSNVAEPLHPEGCWCKKFGEDKGHVFLKGEGLECVIACAAFALQKNDASQPLNFIQWVELSWRC
jgi:hypothetical protein